MRYSVKTSFRASSDASVNIREGVVLTFKRRQSEWAGWIWCTTSEGDSCWVPERWVRINSEDTCIMLREYTCTELTVSAGQVLEGIETESGWLFARTATDEKGWVPLTSLQIMKNRLKVLFLCTGNSCRSQMAEGFARKLKGDVLEVFSAGIETHGLNPMAVQVMRETGVDITGQWSKTVSELCEREFDYVITVCDNASENCPYFPAGIRIVHRGFDDPPVLARNAGSIEGKLDSFRRVRDEIKAFIEELPDSLEENHTV